MKKILFTANLDSFFTKFLIPQLKYFKENGYEVHVASRNENIDIPYCDKKIDVCFARSFKIKDNINSYKQMKKIISEGNYDLISTHTPFGAAITRLAAHKVKTKSKIVYMAHGFHFYKGAPLINWLLYYNAEKYLAKFTDTIITINNDDYEIAKSKFKTNVEYVNGVGLPTAKFDFELSKSDRTMLLKELNLSPKDFIIIYSAELLPRKRQIWLMDSLAPLLSQSKNVHLLLPGKDSMNGKCQKYAKDKEIDGKVHFLGFRTDIPKLLKISNLAVSSSKQEGLPVNIMEAMYCNLPLVVTNCRGNADLVENDVNGYVVGVNDKNEFCNKVKYIIENKKMCDKFRKNSKLKIEKYLIDPTLYAIVNIYKKYSR